VTRPGPDSTSEAALKSNMSLRKGATFHVPSSPSSSSTDFVPPRLSRASSHFDDVVDANRRRMELTLSGIDEALSLSPDDASTSPKSKYLSLRDNSIPIPRGLFDLPVVDLAMAKEAERRVLRPRSARHSRHHASDSGLGTSIASTREKDAAASKAGLQTASAITRSAAASAGALPGLREKAVNRIKEHILGPLLEKPTLKPFKTIVVDVPRRIRDKEILCLRDLEKTLLFMAPVSQLESDVGVWGETYRALLVKEKAKTAALYLDFCLTSIRCIQATVEYLNDRDEQVRPGDRPYTNGYFIDLKEQIYQYGRDLAAAKDKNDMDLDQADEIRLHGGIAQNGRPAELIRVKKNGTAISLATGLPVDLGEGPAKLKRSLSEQREDEEEIMRSMARRKKNATPEELAPKKCREPGCDKEFKRPCDLTKHEKTHSRPWKCPNPTCKYHEFGWPTEKEMDRHINDKHSDAPAMYQCLFENCPYKSKRESNCKQHMEKAHGWTYVRTKTNKKAPAKSTSSAQQTPPLGNVSTPSTTPAYNVPTPPQDAVPSMASDFPLYQADADWLATNNLGGNGLDSMDMDLEMFDNTSPTSATSHEYPPYQNGSTFILNPEEDLYVAPMHMPPTAMPTPEHQMFDKLLPQQFANFQPVATMQQNYLQPHFSPTGQQNAMLYTPKSLLEDDVFGDEGFENDADFQLFDNAGKQHAGQTLFGEIPCDVPSADMGFSQITQQQADLLMDWATMDSYNPFQE
jgi:hypothetical protein